MYSPLFHILCSSNINVESSFKINNWNEPLSQSYVFTRKVIPNGILHSNLAFVCSKFSIQFGLFKQNLQTMCTLICHKCCVLPTDVANIFLLTWYSTDIKLDSGFKCKKQCEVSSAPNHTVQTIFAECARTCSKLKRRNVGLFN